jgi:hypothetical protein
LYWALLPKAQTFLHSDLPSLGQCKIKKKEEDVMLKLSGLTVGTFVLLLILFVGCSSYPQARYYKADSNVDRNDKNLIAFSLQASSVTISKQKKPGPEEKENQTKAQLATLGLTEETTAKCSADGLRDTQAFATQMDGKNSLYFLKPKDTFLTKSNMSISYFDGYQRIKSIGTDFQDDRIASIQALGGIVASVLAVAAAEPPKEVSQPIMLKLPLVLDFTDPAMFTEQTRDVGSSIATIPNNDKCCYKYKISKPQAALPTSDFFKCRSEFWSPSTWLGICYTREFPVSACVDLTLEIGTCKDKDNKKDEKVWVDNVTPKEYVVRIPDPTFVETLPYPLKGSITTHTVCGADISTQPSKSASTFGLLEAIGKQVQAIQQKQKDKTQAAK